MTKIFNFAAVFAFAAAPALAQTWSSNAPQIGPINQPEGIMIHPAPASANYCPTGLQPITIGGVICCGRPNTNETYYNRASQRGSWEGNTCPAGTKGCD